MHFRFRKGPMPKGGNYEEFAELLARLHRTFEPLKERGGEDAEDFTAVKAALSLFAARHGVAAPQELLAEQGGLTGYATPFEVLDHLSAIVRDFGLCHPQDGLDDEYRKTVAWTFFAILHRHRVIDAAFAMDEKRGRVALGVNRWLKPDSTPMEEIFAPTTHAKEYVMHEPCEKFVGKAVVLDPHTGEPAGYEAYVCLLLTGVERIPGIVVCDAKTLDDLRMKLKASDLNARFAHAKLTYEPPTGTYPINNSGALQRFEALALDELYRFQASSSA